MKRKSLNKESILFISHSSESTGGGEEDFLRLLKFFYDEGKYKIFTAIPEGPRLKDFQKYSHDSILLKHNIFPFERFSFKSYLKFFIKSLSNIRRISKYLKQRNIDTAFLNSSVCFMESVPLVWKNVPFTVSIKEKVDPEFTRKRIYGYYQKYSCRVVVISKYLKDLFVKSVKNGDCDIIYSTFNQDEIEFVKKPGKQNKFEDDFVIINVGVISPNKGQDVLIKAVNELGFNNIKVKFIGRVANDSYNDYLKKLIELSPYSDNFLFLGEKKHSLVLSDIFNSDCVVVSSLQEGLSLVILEALALGVPLVSSNVGIAPEVIEDGINGFVYPPGDIDLLADKIAGLYNNYYDLKELSVNAVNSSKRYELNASLESYKNMILSCN